MDLQTVVTWLKRLANLDMGVFDEVRTNPAATIPGVLIAGTAMLISGIGGWLWWVVKDYPAQDDSPLPAMDVLVHSGLVGAALATVLWGFIWLLIVYVMLTQVFGERAYVEQLLRVMGLAAAPMALMGLMFVPGISLAIGVTALALTVALTNIAIKTVTTAESVQVLAANLFGFFVWCSAMTLLASAVEPHAPGVFLFNSISRVADDVLSFGSSAAVEQTEAFCYASRTGAVAQLGERLTGSQKVGGSNPPSSTKKQRQEPPRSCRLLSTRNWQTALRVHDEMPADAPKQNAVPAGEA